MTSLLSWAYRRRSCSRPSIGTTSSTSGWVQRKAPMASWPSHFPWGRRSSPSIAAEDIGKVAYAIFEKGEEMIGKTVGIAGGHLSGAQMAKSFTKALGQEVRYNAV